MEIGNQIQEATISAVVTRADGTVEDLGVIDSHNADIVECPACSVKVSRHDLDAHNETCEHREGC